MDSAFLIGHLDTGSPPDHPNFNGKIYESVSYNEAGLFQKKAMKGSRDSHSSLSTRIIFKDDQYSLPTLHSGAKLATVSIPSRGKTILNVLQGMDYLLDLAPQIVCMPIGFRKTTPIFYPMICAFHDKEIPIIVPIGNSGKGKAQVPGYYPNVISVGAVETDGKVAKYSGSYLDDSGNCLKPDILAIGNSIPSSSQLSKKGTSFACAYIAGTAARILQAQPLATLEEIKHALFSTTQSLLPSQSNRCKRGIVQADAAFEFFLQKKKIIPPKLDDTIPSFLSKPYQDPRFLSQFKNAKPDQLLEGIILPSSSQEKAKNSKTPSPRSQKLIAQIQKVIRIQPKEVHFFVHTDMAHLIASPAFFEVLLKDPNLFLISAVDVNTFEL